VLCELSIKVFRLQVIVVTQFVLVHYVCEVLQHQLFFLFVKNVDFRINLLEPGVDEDFIGSESLLNIDFDHFAHQVNSLLADDVFKLNLLLKLELCQLAHVIGLKGHVSIEDSKQADTSRPDVYWETLVANLLDDLGSDVRRRAALLEQKLV
jgi:hypothetical protein